MYTTKAIILEIHRVDLRVGPITVWGPMYNTHLLHPVVAALHRILCLSHFTSNSLHSCDSCKCTARRHLNTCYKTSKNYFIWLARLPSCADRLSKLCDPQSPPLNKQEGKQSIIQCTVCLSIIFLSL
jgi:hypothetical protein